MLLTKCWNTEFQIHLPPDGFNPRMSSCKRCFPRKCTQVGNVWKEQRQLSVAIWPLIVVPLVTEVDQPAKALTAGPVVSPGPQGSIMVWENILL